ncbi:hypothetical protein [Serratia sp. (in: enterobacteria)]|uniref:hypothetical protein n=1 Tax=Serratia sp. (in: enterobacteria) TaxID=616 RepID=UPI0039892E0C
MNRIQYIVYLVASLLFASSIPLVTVSAEKCEDITGVEKWGSESHGDNNPSEKKFEKMLNDESVGICKLAQAIDHMEVTGSVDDWSDFKETTVFMGTTEKVQDCLKDRYELPDDDGDEHLADYEIQKCATGDY